MRSSSRTTTRALTHNRGNALRWIRTNKAKRAGDTNANSSSPATERGGSIATIGRDTAVRLCAAALASAILVGGASFIAPQTAFAQECVGANERVALDFSDVHYLIKIDSCKAEELMDAYGDVKDAAGLAALLVARWWPVGTSSAIFYAWAWNNQAKVRDAARAGQGVEFDQAMGVVVNARPQR